MSNILIHFYLFNWKPSIKKFALQKGEIKFEFHHDDDFMSMPNVMKISINLVAIPFPHTWSAFHHRDHPQHEKHIFCLPNHHKERDDVWIFISISPGFGPCSNAIYGKWKKGCPKKSSIYCQMPMKYESLDKLQWIFLFYWNHLDHNPLSQFIFSPFTTQFERSFRWKLWIMKLLFCGSIWLQNCGLRAAIQ